jgi:hypothetical protein
VRRESFESLNEVRVPEEEEEKSKKPGKGSKKGTEEGSDLEDDVREVAVVQRDLDRCWLLWQRCPKC